MRRPNLAQKTMFDDFAQGVYRPSPAVPVSGKTAETRATSSAAAAAVGVQLGGLRLDVLRFIADRAEYGATDIECQRGLDLEGSTQRPRRIELASAGLIEPAGKRKAPSGRDSVVWIATNAGKDAV